MALILLAQAVANHPEALEGVGERVLAWANSLRGKPADEGLARWRQWLQQLGSVRLTRPELARALTWALLNCIADATCLTFSAFATGGRPSLAGVTVAYAAATAVGSVPLTPGGLVVLESVLVPGLVSSGLSLANAISATLIYRLVKWVFIAAIGWIVFLVLFRDQNQIDPVPWSGRRRR